MARLGGQVAPAQRLTRPGLQRGRGFATVSAAMSRVARTAAPAAEPQYPVWKTNAVKALKRLHERAAIVTPERLWTQLYIRRLDPAEAAELAAREYDSTHPPAWVKRPR
jgi:hypothetical protein